MELGRNKSLGRGRGKDRGEVKCPWEMGMARRVRSEVPLVDGGGMNMGRSEVSLGDGGGKKGE